MLLMRRILGVPLQQIPEIAVEVLKYCDGSIRIDPWLPYEGNSPGEHLVVVTYDKRNMSNRLFHRVRRMQVNALEAAISHVKRN